MNSYQIVEFYISLKRLFYNKPFIKIPKKETQDWDNLNRLYVLLSERDISYEDYIMVQVRAYKRRNVFPTPAHLLGLKALNRYSEYVNKEYTVGESYRTDRSSVLIRKTNVYYPIEEFIKPFDKDMKVLTVWTFAKEGKINFDGPKMDKVREMTEYVVSKYEYFKQQVPDSLLKWRDKLYDTQKTNDQQT